MEKFIEASKKFIEWKKNPNGKTREEFAKFVNEDPPVAWRMCYLIFIYLLLKNKRVWSVIKAIRL